jgi:hypothetical protein
MIVFRESSTRHKELFRVLVPLVQLYQKKNTAIKDTFNVTDKMASFLDEMDYAPKEITGIEKRVFFDMVKEWEVSASEKDRLLIRTVFPV